MKATVIAPGLVTLLAPECDLQLDAESVEWAVAKPANLTKSHGVDMTLERLEEMAASYNAEAIEAAAVNFDHANGGPAQGWVQSLSVRDGMLWARPAELSDEMVNGIKSGRYRRASIEVVTRHPETAGWYLTGLAVLGARNPAIKGLPPLRLSAPRYVLQLSDPDPATVAPPLVEDEPTTPPEAPGQEQSMSDKKNPEASGPVTAAEDETKPSLREAFAALGRALGLSGKEEAKAEPAPAAAASLSAADVKALIAESRNADAVDADLRALSSTVPPAILQKPETRALLLSARGQSAEMYKAALDLVAGRDASALLSGPIAGAQQTAAGRTGLTVSAEDLAYLEAAGCSAEKVAHLEARYGPLGKPLIHAIHAAAN